jgi:hypothetical protein
VCKVIVRLVIGQWLFVLGLLAKRMGMRFPDRGLGYRAIVVY